MHITDTIADMLTRIRNANAAKHDTVDIPASNMKKAIAQILLDEGYIKAFSVTEDGKQGVITITLKYGPGKNIVEASLRRPHVERHLAAFKAGTDMSAGTGLQALVASAGGLAVAGTGASSHAEGLFV